MRKLRLIFFLVYGIFHLGLTIISLYADHVYANSNFNQLIELGKRIPLAKWLAFFGCLLFIFNIGLFYMLRRAHISRTEAFEKERNLLKAKMFDLQSATVPADKDKIEETGETKDV